MDTLGRLNIFVSSEITLLVPEFRQKLIAVVAACKSRNIEIAVIRTIISPREQASLWKQGRTPVEAELKRLALQNAGASYLADCLAKSQAKATNLVTDELPGYSWHQWGEAATCVWVDSARKLQWSHTHTDYKGGINGLGIMVEEAIKLGLTSGNTFPGMENSWTHLQLRQEKSPLDVYTIQDIDAEMRKRFIHK